MHAYRRNLSTLWTRAALLGSLWASVEIIFGSFLHNLRIPLAGTLLAAIGVLIMIQGHRLWPQPGLLWRTALITAAMKSISPSALIIGPMLGIFMEGVLLEFGLRLFRGRWPGLVLGGALAVSWSLFQKILVLTFTFGFNLVLIYNQLVATATRQLGIDSLGPLDLVLALFIVDMLFGAAVAFYAVHFHADPAQSAPQVQSFEDRSAGQNPLETTTKQTFSLKLFFINLLVIPGGLYLLSTQSLILNYPLIALYIIWNVNRYRGSLRRLKRPRLWLQLIGIMLLSGLILGGVQDQVSFMNGIYAGLGMIIRASLLIFAISALSVEIRNPIILAWVDRHGFQAFFRALSYAFNTLPGLVAILNAQPKLWKAPLRTLSILLSHIEAELERTVGRPAELIFLTGDRDEGKTTLLKSIADPVREEGFRLGGFISEKVFEKGELIGYNLTDLVSEITVPLCRLDGLESPYRTGPFTFDPSGIYQGNKILTRLADENFDLVIVDEMGPLEMGDQAWAESISALLDNKPGLMIWTVRPALIEGFKLKWALDPIILDVKNTRSEDLVNLIMNPFITDVERST